MGMRMLIWTGNTHNEEKLPRHQYGGVTLANLWQSSRFLSNWRPHCISAGKCAQNSWLRQCWQTNQSANHQFWAQIIHVFYYWLKQSLCLLPVHCQSPANHDSCDKTGRIKTQQQQQKDEPGSAGVTQLMIGLEKLCLRSLHKNKLISPTPLLRGQ